MGNLVFNIAKGRVAELHDRVKNNDPANAAIVLVAINAGAATDGTMKDYDTLAALLADGDVAEVTNSGYARKVLTDSDLAATPAPDDTNDRNERALPTQVFSSVAAGSAWTDIVVCYDPDTTAGDDSNIVPLTLFDFPQTPNGGDIQVTGGNYYRAGE